MPRGCWLAWRWPGSGCARSRFDITEQGLDLRTAGLNRVIGWHEIEQIVLGPPALKPHESAAMVPPALLLVPAPGVDLAVTLDDMSAPSGKPARKLLSTADVRQSADQIAAALAQHAGGRFVDARPSADIKSVAETPDFAVVLRGYDRQQVDMSLQAIPRKTGCLSIAPGLGSGPSRARQAPSRSDGLHSLCPVACARFARRVSILLAWRYAS